MCVVALSVLAALTCAGTAAASAGSLSLSVTPASVSGVTPFKVRATGTTSRSGTSVTVSIKPGAAACPTDLSTDTGLKIPLTGGVSTSFNVVGIDATGRFADELIAGTDHASISGHVTGTRATCSFTEAYTTSDGYTCRSGIVSFSVRRG